jgi:hypothetical protein
MTRWASVLGESWEWDGEPENCPTDYAVSYAREFRYDNAMQRYMNTELDPTDDFDPSDGHAAPAGFGPA